MPASVLPGFFDRHERTAVAAVVGCGQRQLPLQRGQHQLPSKRGERQLRLRPQLLTPVINTDDFAGNTAALGALAAQKSSYTGNVVPLVG